MRCSFLLVKFLLEISFNFGEAVVKCFRGILTGQRKLEEDTAEYLVQLER